MTIKAFYSPLLFALILIFARCRSVWNMEMSQFATVQCPADGVKQCGISQPSEIHNDFSRGQCTVACRRVGGCNRFNFITIDDEINIQPERGQCQLFDRPPQVGVWPRCTLYASYEVSFPVGTPPGFTGILVQQHYNGSTFFQRTWNEFKAGFGDVNLNYWIGNEQLYQLTDGGQRRLRIDVQARSNCQWYWAEYSTFSVEKEAAFYRLTIGGYSGTAGDAMTLENNSGAGWFNLNGMGFTTFDSDNDVCGDCNCAVQPISVPQIVCPGGFWSRVCHRAFINTPADCASGAGFMWWGLPTADEKLMYSRLTLI